MNLLPYDLILVVGNAYCMYLGVVVSDAPDILLYRLIEHPQGPLGEVKARDAFRVNKEWHWQSRVHKVKPEDLNPYHRALYDKAVAQGTYTPQ